MATVADCYHQNHESIVFNCGNDPIVADAETIELVFAFELLDARREEILLQAINAAGELPLSALGKRC